MRYREILCLIFALFLLSSCSSVRRIRPLPKGQMAISGSVGGPLTSVGDVTIPLPLVSLAVNYGAASRWDLQAGVHLTSAFFGIAHFDAGVNWHPWGSNRFRPGLLVSPKLSFLTDFSPSGFRLYPSCAFTGFWEITPRWAIYTGLDNWWELRVLRTDGRPQEHRWLPTLHLGISLCSKKWEYVLESKLFLPGVDNSGRPVKNVGLDQKGMLGFFIGISRAFGGGRQ